MHELDERNKAIRLFLSLFSLSLTSSCSKEFAHHPCVCRQYKVQTEPSGGYGMAHGGLAGFIRRMAEPEEYAQATDRALLTQFASGRDEVAFEAIVYRH